MEYRVAHDPMLERQICVRPAIEPFPLHLRERSPSFVLLLKRDSQQYRS